ALIVCSFYLGRRRRRAFHAALALLLGLAVLDLLKGFDFEEAALSLGAAALLWAGRGAFYVRHDRHTLLRALAGATITVGLVAGFVAAITHVDSPRLLTRETTHLLRWRHPPLALGAVGVGAQALPLFRDARLRALYIGDEAIVETARFSLEGRAIRKVRQSVSRLEAAGYSISAHALGELRANARADLHAVSARW